MGPVLPEDFLCLGWHLRPFCPRAQNIPAPQVLLVSPHCQDKDNLGSSHFPLKSLGPVLTLLSPGVVHPVVICASSGCRPQAFSFPIPTHELGYSVAAVPRGDGGCAALTSSG